MKNKDKFGIEEEYILLINSIFRKNILNNQKVKVWIIGSRSNGKYQKYSDIDFLIESSPIFTDKQKFNLEDNFEESNLPYKVDLVFMENVYQPYLENFIKNRKIFTEF